MNSAPFKVNPQVMSRSMSFLGKQIIILLGFFYRIIESMICIKILHVNMGSSKWLPETAYEFAIDHFDKHRINFNDRISNLQIDFLEGKKEKLTI